MAVETTPFFTIQEKVDMEQKLNEFIVNEGFLNV